MNKLDKWLDYHFNKVRPYLPWCVPLIFGILLGNLYFHRQFTFMQVIGWIVGFSLFYTWLFHEPKQS